MYGVLINSSFLRWDLLFKRISRVFFEMAIGYLVNVVWPVFNFLIRISFTNLRIEGSRNPGALGDRGSRISFSRESELD